MRLAAVVARRHGIGDPVRPLRSGANHVFQAGDVLIRVAPPKADVSGQVALARWLAAKGFPVAAPLTEPECVGDTQLSLWEYIDDDEQRPIDFQQLGEVVGRLHRIDPGSLSDVVSLPFCGDAAWLAIEQSLAEIETLRLLDAEGLGALRRAGAALRGWRERARRDATVLCHGDVHPQNVLMHDDKVVLIDWDGICLGPPAWDHAALMTWAGRWGGGARTYTDFARGYGADLRQSPIAQELAKVRLLAPTINMVLNGATDSAKAAEAKLRMRYWLGDPAAPSWTPL
jgi:Ser/Thr protein kinase RdoA (MazF antagonist)